VLAKNVREREFWTCSFEILEMLQKKC
jgi:hypothetical protein